VESVEYGGSGYNVVIRLTGEGEEVQVQTRWKDRGGQPKIVEASHLSRAAIAAEDAGTDTEPAEPGESRGE